MRYVFVDSFGVVRQVIVGSLGALELSQFERDYAVLFGTTSVIEVADASVSIWIGGTYTPEAGFTPPPPPDPEIVESIVEGMNNDDAPIE